MHPSYPRPIFMTEQPKFVDILNLEKIHNFKDVRKLLTSTKEGSYLLQVDNTTLVRYTFDYFVMKVIIFLLQLRYTWKNVMDWYVVCIVVSESDSPPRRPYKVTWFPSSVSSKLLHHRLDILPGTNLCKHLNQVATLGKFDSI